MLVHQRVYDVTFCWGSHGILESSGGLAGLDDSCSFRKCFFASDLYNSAHHPVSQPGLPSWSQRIPNGVHIMSSQQSLTESAGEVPHGAAPHGLFVNALVLKYLVDISPMVFHKNQNWKFISSYLIKIVFGDGIKYGDLYLMIFYTISKRYQKILERFALRRVRFWVSPPPRSRPAFRARGGTASAPGLNPPPRNDIPQDPGNLKLGEFFIYLNFYYACNYTL